MIKIKSSGFTMVELLITIAIVSITLSLAIPSFSSLLINSRIKKLSSDFISSINIAKIESVKRQVPVTICKSSNSNNDNPTCDSGSGDWNSGWIIFSDGATLGKVETSNSEEILNVFISTGNHVEKINSAEFSKYITFQPNGFIKGSNGYSGEIILCVNNSDSSVFNKRIINVSTTGRLHVTKSNGAC